MTTLSYGHKGAKFRSQHGITLIEVLISLVLGLLLVGAATSIFLSNRQTYRQIENLARLQENARIAFELLGRDVREAGGIACGSNLPVANVVANAAGNWWSNWGTGIQGYASNVDDFPARTKGNGPGARLDRANDNDALFVLSGSIDGNVPIQAHDDAVSPIKANTATHGFQAGDLLVACDMQQAAVFQVTGVAGVDIQHGTPANERDTLGLVGTENYRLQAGGVLSRLRAYAWYVGNNGRGGTSLYRRPAGANPEEMIENVTGLNIQYLVSGPLAAAYVDAADVPDWARVVAVRINPTYATAEAVGTNNAVIQQTLPFVISIRNRLPPI